MQERAAVFEQALPFFLSQPTGENQPADHARERAGRLFADNTAATTETEIA